VFVAGCSPSPSARSASPTSTATSGPAPRLQITTTTTTTTTTSTTAVPAPTTTATPKAPPSDPACATSAAGLSSTGSAEQLILVEAPTYTTTYAALSAWQRQAGCWVEVLGPWTARIGANGFSDHKTEGDDTTPTGAYGIGPVMYGNVPDPGVDYPYHQLVCGDWWDEDPSSSPYNSFQHVPCGQPPPFGGDSEALWQETTAYPSFAVVDYNTDPVVPGAGSAIFIHADVGGPTAGCVSLPLGQLDQLLRWLEPSEAPLVVMGPSAEIASF
jgi:L,D-peptidoglycan transpeptidase YkuD (ErfK/YbiS/YcfS/YnhG family)